MGKRPALVSILVATFFAFALGCGAAQEVPPLEQRAQQVNGSVMCPVCPGESIDQSQHPLAVQMRGIVAEKLAQGWSESQIRRFFSERYGPSVLLEPPRDGANLVVWLAPPAGVAAAAGLLLLSMRSMMRRRPTERDMPLAGVALSAEEREDFTRRVSAATSGGAQDVSAATSGGAQDEREGRPGDEAGGAA